MNETADLTDADLRHLTGWAFVLDKPKHLAVAVSGGGDSMACLDLMRWHARDLGFAISAVTVDHGLRAEAKDEIALVAAYCAKHDIKHSVLTWAWDGVGNLQAEARNARHNLITAWARDRGVDWVALGHTQDDAAETFLMRLARQAGVDGLAHMAARFERNDLTWVRPLLSLRRADWRQYLQRRNIQWAEDPSNEDETFDRVKARRVLAELASLGIDTHTITAVAHHQSSAKLALNHYTYQETAQYGQEEHGDVILPTDMAEKGHLIPPEIMFRMRRAALSWVSGSAYSPRSEAFIHLDAGLHESGTHTLAGCVVTRLPGERRYLDRWRITREYNAVKDVSSSTNALWDGRWQMTGPHHEDLEVRALGDALSQVPKWRETGLPRQSLLASPAIWQNDTLIAAPIAGLKNGWEASATGRGTFTQFLLSR